ncbi:hypothetical protein [Arthrospira platensis]|nr:hypothetical protein [Arthrospira platensis]MDT9183676.1 hypothetical protein [Limnospira sp. PMC 289.06]
MTSLTCQKRSHFITTDIYFGLGVFKVVKVPYKPTQFPMVLY